MSRSSWVFALTCGVKSPGQWPKNPRHGTPKSISFSIIRSNVRQHLSNFLHAGAILDVIGAIFDDIGMIFDDIEPIFDDIGTIFDDIGQISDDIGGFFDDIEK